MTGLQSLCNGVFKKKIVREAQPIQAWPDGLSYLAENAFEVTQFPVEWVKYTGISNESLAVGP